MAKAEKVALFNPTNGAKDIIGDGLPFIAHVTLEGVSDMLFHRWNCEAVDEKAKAAKGSKAKKSDDIESYVYRDEKGFLCLPGEYVRQAMIYAAKSKQDPRSPRKSAMDLFKAGVVSLTQLSSLGTKEWDYLDRRRVVIQRNGINRTRPAMRVGWQADFEIAVTTPEYISQQLFIEVLQTAGRLIGVGDFRPTYGRFSVKNYNFMEG